MSVLKNYQDLTKPLHLNAFKEARFTSNTELIFFEKVEQLDEYICNKNPQQGWICYQSVVQRFMEEETLPERDETTGYLLNAEFVLDNDRSLHIRMAETGWIVNIIKKQTGHDLLEKTHYLAMPEKESEETMGNFKQRLNYHVIWTLDNDNGYQPSNYRFTGFSEGAN